MRAAQTLGVEAEPRRDRGLVVVQQQVGVGGQAVEHGAAGIGLEVDDQAALVAVDRCEVRAAAIRRIAPVGRTPAARLVAVGRLDLPDLGAQVAEEHAGDRPRVDARAVEHADAGEGEGGVHRSGKPSLIGEPPVPVPCTPQQAGGADEGRGGDADRARRCDRSRPRLGRDPRRRPRRRGGGLRLDLGLRPPPLPLRGGADDRDPRGLDDPLRARRRDDAPRPRGAGAGDAVPQPGAAGQDGDDAGRGERRAADPGGRLRLA